MTDTLTARWEVICPQHWVEAERGVAALVADTQVAIFRTFGGEIFAIDNRDPIAGAYVMSRGIVGSRGDAPTVASPLHKEVYDLRTGACLDVAGVVVRTYAVRVRDGMVEVSAGT